MYTHFQYYLFKYVCCIAFQNRLLAMRCLLLSFVHIGSVIICKSFYSISDLTSWKFFLKKIIEANSEWTVFYV